MTKQSATQTNVTPQRIIEDLWAGWRAQTLVAAVELDLFTHIAEGKRTSKEIARSASSSEHGTRRLLDALVGLGYLNKGATGTVWSQYLKPFSSVTKGHT